MRTALLPGSFDPFTNGHLATLWAALAIADRVMVTIGVHSGKTPLFTPEERIAMIREVVASLPPEAGERIGVVSFDGLMVDAARAAEATLLVRGVRAGSDFDYEMQMAGMNAAVAPEIYTVLVPAPPGVRHITATLVRQIARLGGDVDAFVPAAVARRLKEQPGR